MASSHCRDTRSVQEELERSNQHLASQNATLRCALESAEELNAQLAEEVAKLTEQLQRSGGTHRCWEQGTGTCGQLQMRLCSSAAG